MIKILNWLFWFVLIQPTTSEKDMVFVPSGTFWMGCNSEAPYCKAEWSPLHQVTLDSFWIDIYEVTVFEQYQPSYRTCCGEIKGEDFSDTSSNMDRNPRLAVFSKLEMVSSNLTGVFCFQALGRSITFYTMVHPNSSIFAFVGLVIMPLIGYLDEVYKIAVYHRTIVKSLTANANHPTLPFEFVQGSKKH